MAFRFLDKQTYYFFFLSSFIHCQSTHFYGMKFWRGYIRHVLKSFLSIYFCHWWSTGGAVWLRGGQPGPGPDGRHREARGLPPWTSPWTSPVDFPHIMAGSEGLVDSAGKPHHGRPWGAGGHGCQSKGDFLETIISNGHNVSITQFFFFFKDMI